MEEPYVISVKKRSKHHRRRGGDSDDDNNNDDADLGGNQIDLDPDNLLEEIDQGEERMEKERAKHNVLIDDRMDEDPFSKKDREMLRLFQEQQKRAAEEAAKAPKHTREEVDKRRKQIQEASNNDNNVGVSPAKKTLAAESAPEPSAEQIVMAQNEEIRQLRRQLAEKAAREREEKEQQEQQKRSEDEQHVKKMLMAQQLYEQEEKDRQQLEVYNKQLHELMMARNAIKHRLEQTAEENKKVKEKEMLRQTNTNPEDLAKAKENNPIFKPNKGIQPVAGRRGIGVSKRR